MTLLQMTSEQVDALSRETIVLFPCGAVEQHSTHLPVCTDTVLVEAVATRAAAEAGEACLLLPTLWLGASHHHLAFPGTLSASTLTHAAMVRDVLESLIRNRFERFLVLNGHGGNTDPIHVALRELATEHPNTTLGSASYWELAKSQFAEIASGPLRHVGHACEIETSMMLALNPDLVRKERIDDDFLELSAPIEGLEVTTGFDVRTTHGGRGYPSYASAEKGERFLEAAVSAVSAAVRAMRVGLHWTAPAESR